MINRVDGFISGGPLSLCPTNPNGCLTCKLGVEWPDAASSENGLARTDPEFILILLSSAENISVG